MIGSDQFTSVFGGAPEHTRSHFVEHIRAIVRAGYSPVLCKPGTAESACTLGVMARKRAAINHSCGANHVIDDPAKAGTIMKRWLDEYGDVNIALHLGRSNLAVLRNLRPHNAPVTVAAPQWSDTWFAGGSVPIPVMHLQGPGWELLGGDMYALVPPARVPAGAYRLVGGTIPAPDWMLG